MVTKEWGEFVFAPPSAKEEELIVPPADEAHHLFRVRRVEPNSEVYVTDGEGMAYRCVVLENRALQIVETLPAFGEPVNPITLCAAVLKGESNREVVDIATQLGASAIVFFQAQRSEGKLREDKLEKLKRVAVTAIKQCGRACLPLMTIDGSLQAALDRLPQGGTKYIAHPFEDLRESATGPTLSVPESSAVIIGPEGGFTEAEVDTAIRR